MAQWDIFHSGRLEVQRGLSTEEVLAALQSGEILQDDLVRPSGSTTPWARLADLPEFLVNESGTKVDAEPASEAEPIPEVEASPAAPEPTTSSAEYEVLEAEIVDDDFEDVVSPASEFEEPLEAELADDPTPPLAIPPVEAKVDADSVEGEPILAEVVEEDEFLGEARDLPEFVDPIEEDEAIAAFSLASTPGEETEPIDLTAMVDVAFQLILFFLVTSTTIYFKALEIPEPSPDDQESVAQDIRTLDDLLEDYILVEIDSEGSVQVDREPIEPTELISRMRQAREDTLRTAMLLMADFTTPHANAVRAYDAANELGLGIAIAKPTAPAIAEGG